jgi:Ca2+-binding RTX toxin-like protein
MIELIFTKNDIAQKTIFDGFDGYESIFLDQIWTIYSKSSTANGLLNSYLRNKTIKITYDSRTFAYNFGTNTIQANLASLLPQSYITDKGTVVEYSLLGAVAHELSHMLTEKHDPKQPYTTDYIGDNVRQTEIIWSELRKAGETGLDPQVSITGLGFKISQIVGRNYTNYEKIDAAVDVGFQEKTYWSSEALPVNPLTQKPQNVLLLGSSKSDYLISGNGNDYLYGRDGDDILDGGNGNNYFAGGSGDDILLGGSGTDIAGYIGSKNDYTIKKEKNGTWSITKKKQTLDAGTDTLVNVEFAQFKDIKRFPLKLTTGSLTDQNGEVSQDALYTTEETETFELKKNGLTFQKDIVLVFDTTGSMAGNSGYRKGDVEYLKLISKAIITAATDNDNDVRVGIVGFKDTTNGEASQLILPFTDQDDLTERQSTVNTLLDSMVDVRTGYYDGDLDSGAAANLRLRPDWYYTKTNSITTTSNNSATNIISFGGGGDGLETPFDGLMLALSKSIGEWRYGAGTRQIVLFTDAPAKDKALESQVTNLAHGIGAEVTQKSSMAIAADTSVGSFNLTFNNASSSATANNTIDIDSTAAEVQIFIVYLGTSSTDTTEYSLLANDNGGAVLNNPTTTELIGKLFTPNPNTVINGTANVDTLLGTDGNDTLYGLAGNDTIYGGTGDDIIFGGAGVDLLFGGAGNDIFRFNRSTDGIDKINDFVFGSDRIEIASAGFGGSGVVGNAGVLDASMFSLGTSATTSSQRFIYNDTSGGLFFDADGIGGTAQVRLAQLVGNPTLTNDSFRIV